MHKARLLSHVGVRGAREYPPLTHIQSNACWFLFLLFAYLLVAEAASFDKKELCRSDTERNTKILDNEKRINREGTTEKYKQHEWAKMNPETFYYLQEKHVSRENSSLKLNGTVITNPEDIVRTDYAGMVWSHCPTHNFTLQMKGQ